MERRLWKIVGLLRLILFGSIIGAFTYGAIGSTIVRGEHAIAIHGYFRWADLSNVIGLSFIAIPFAIPTAVAMSVFLNSLSRPSSHLAVFAYALAIAAVMVTLTILFPLYMALLDHVNNWRRAMLLPASTSLGTVLTWVTDRLPVPRPAKT